MLIIFAVFEEFKWLAESLNLAFAIYLSAVVNCCDTLKHLCAVL